MPRKITVAKDVIFHADLASVHRVLLDTKSYPSYINNIESAQVIYQKNDESEVSFKAKIAFFSFEYSIKTTKVSDHHITFEQKKGFFRFLHGEWRLKEDDGKVEGKYIVNVRLPLFVTGNIVEKAMNMYFPAMLDAFKTEIERQSKDE